MEQRPNCQSAESEPRAQFSVAERRMQTDSSSLVLHWTREDSFSSLVLHWPLEISPFAYRACSFIMPCGCWYSFQPLVQHRFDKLGLMLDDTIYEDDDVKEAIRRLPENLCNYRVFLIKRALDLGMRQQILPKERWTEYEEDKFYLELYLKEVIQERKEREEWAKK